MITVESNPIVFFWNGGMNPSRAEVANLFWHRLPRNPPVIRSAIVSHKSSTTDAQLLAMRSVILIMLRKSSAIRKAHPKISARLFFSGFYQYNVGFTWLSTIFSEVAVSRFNPRASLRAVCCPTAPCGAENISHVRKSPNRIASTATRGQSSGLVRCSGG